MADRAVDVGAALTWGERFLGARRDGDAIRAGDHRVRVLVGADGARSRVARTFGLGVNRRFLFGAEWELEGLRGIDENRLHCFLTREFAPGYLGWAVPGLGVTQIGVAGTAPFRPRLEAFVERLSKIFDFGRARVIAAHFDASLFEPANGSKLKFLSLDGMTVLALSSIGNPDAFEKGLEKAGAKLISYRCADHHGYNLEDWVEILDAAKQYDAVIVTTEKDWVKLKPFAKQMPPRRLLVSQLTVAFSGDDERVWNAAIDKALGR
jgi:hypothetical protein